MSREEAVGVARRPLLTTGPGRCQSSVTLASRRLFPVNIRKSPDTTNEGKIAQPSAEPHRHL